MLQLSFFTCHAETRFKIRVSRMEPGCDALSDIRIVEGFGYRGPDHEAAAGASFTLEINGLRRFVSKLQGLAQGPVLRESLSRRGQGDLPVARERL